MLSVKHISIKLEKKEKKDHYLILEVGQKKVFLEEVMLKLSHWPRGTGHRHQLEGTLKATKTWTVDLVWMECRCIWGC